MTIQQHASFDSSAAELNATSKLVKAWESKNAKNAAKAGGVSLMALSLAACGGSSTTTTGNETTPTGSDFTVNADNFTTSGTVSAARAYTPGGNDLVNTLQSDDNVTASGATDVLNVTFGNNNDAGATVVAPTLTGFETINFNSVSSNASTDTLDMGKVTGTTAVNVTAADDSVVIRGMDSAGIAMKVSSVSDETTSVAFEMDSTAVTGATASAVTVDGFEGLNVNVGAGATDTVTGTGIEELKVIASGSASSVASLGSSGVTTLNVDADVSLTVSALTATGITTINAADSSAATSLNVGANISANEFTYTGGTGDDTLIATSGFGATDKLDGGEGANTLSIRPASAAADVTVGSGAATASFANIQTLDMRSATGDGGVATDFTVDMDNVASVTAVTMQTSDTDTKAVFTLNDLNAVQAGALSVTHGGTDVDTDSEIIVDMKDGSGTDTVNVSATVTAAAQVVEINDANNDVENLVVAMSGDVSSSLDLDTGSFLTKQTITSTAGSDKTLTFDQTNAAATIDASGVASKVSITLAGAEQTVTTGAAADTIIAAGTLTKGDSIDGGDGTDILSITNASAGTVAGLTDTQAATLAGNIKNIEKLYVSDALNGNVIDLDDFSGVSTVRLGFTTSFTGNETITDLANGSTVEIMDTPNGATDILTLNTKGAATGSEDTITLKLSKSASSDYGVYALANYETITINTSETTASDTVRVQTADLTITQSGGNQTTLNITGAETFASGAAIDADIIDASGLGQGTVFTMHTAGSTAGSQTITGSDGGDRLVGSSSGDTITGGDGNDDIDGKGGNDVIVGGAGNDTIKGDAGVNISTGGAGSDDFIIKVAATGSTATNVTTITDFNGGTATTGVDQVSFTLAELNAMENDSAFATDVANFVEGDGSVLTTGNASLTTQLISGDGQIGAAATEVFLIGIGTYDNDAAITTAFAAGSLTFSTGTVVDNDAVLIAYKTTGGNVNVAAAQFNGTTGSSDTIDGVVTLAVLEGFSDMSILDASDFLIA